MREPASDLPVVVLLLDDNEALLRGLQRALQRTGCEVHTATNINQARETLERRAVELALLDYELPDGTGADLARWALREGRAQAVYCMTANPGVERIVDAMRAGFTDVLPKPFDIDRLTALVEARRSTRRGELDAWRRQHASLLVGNDPKLVDALAIARDVAATDSTVLITGETGTGKELVAQAIHQSSGRSGPFIAVNCAALPDSLLEAELFGHTRGAFTGAVAAREGRIAASDHGTLFLDEVGDMPLAAQAKLLRVLQDRAVTPVGSDRPVPVDLRVVAATNQDLEAMVEAGTFRSDLYYRLSVIPLHLPSLRERRGDILVLANHFLALACRRLNKAIGGFRPTAEAELRAHSWPGNVRELQHAIERAVVQVRDSSVGAEDLRLGGRRSARSSAPVTPVAALPATPATPEDLNLRTAMDSVERTLITQALDRAGGNRTEAAALLGLNRTTLVEKLRKLGS